MMLDDDDDEKIMFHLWFSYNRSGKTIVVEKWPIRVVLPHKTEQIT